MLEISYMLLHWMICSYKNNIFFLVKEKCFHAEKYDLLSKQQVHSLATVDYFAS